MRTLIDVCMCSLLLCYSFRFYYSLVDQNASWQLLKNVNNWQRLRIKATPDDNTVVIRAELVPEEPSIYSPNIVLELSHADAAAAAQMEMNRRLAATAGVRSYAVS